jgi:two-component system cell cycle sensor histidine kinase/response regulator CckA
MAQGVVGHFERPVVLLVEDDNSVRTVIARVLTREGYEVLSAEHGHAALLLIASLEHPVSLLITDLSLPGLDGEAFVAELARHQRPPPVLFMSGSSPRDVPHLADVLLAKPFKIDDLISRVREILGEPMAAQKETG